MSSIPFSALFAVLLLFLLGPSNTRAFNKFIGAIAPYPQFIPVPVTVPVHVPVPVGVPVLGPKHGFLGHGGGLGGFGGGGYGSSLSYAGSYGVGGGFFKR